MAMFRERDSIRKNSITLGSFALITALLLSITYESTKHEIAQSVREVEEKTLLEIIPLERHSNNLLMDVIEIPEKYWPTLGLDSKALLHIARDNAQNPIAAIFPTIAPDGYSGKIKMIVGVNMDGTIAGVRITEHSETPGLGDKVDLKRSDWVLDFNGKSLQNPTLPNWKVKKDRGQFDQFTGATITPRAVVNQVARALQYFTEDKPRLIRMAERNRFKVQQENRPAERQLNESNND